MTGVGTHTRALKRTLGLAFASIVIGICGSTSLLAYDHAARMHETGMRNGLLVQAALTAQAIDGDLHASLQSRDDAGYAEIRAVLVRSRALDARVRDVYTMARSPEGAWRFLVDAEDPAGPIFSEFGAPYEGTFDAALEGGLSAPSVSAEAYTDDYGTWWSGYAPIRDRSGRAVGIVGVDVAGETFEREESELLVRAAVLFVIAVVTAAVAGRFLLGRIADPVIVEGALQAAERRRLEAIQAITEEHRTRLLVLAKQQTKVEEALRARVAAEVHDGVAQDVAMARILVSKVAADRPELANTLGMAAAVLDVAVRHMNELIVEISPPALRTLGLSSALREAAERLAKPHDIRVAFNADPDVPELSKEAKVAAYWSARELMVNVVKHSGATLMSVSIAEEDNRVVIRVKDDGRGFRPGNKPRSGGGYGLLAACERLDLVGGDLTVDAGVAGGTIATVSIPYPQCASAASAHGSAQDGDQAMASDGGGDARTSSNHVAKEPTGIGAGAW
jgi:signal transduction histidine kinase